jgi:hypothetical protein
MIAARLLPLARVKWPNALTLFGESRARLQLPKLLE